MYFPALYFILLSVTVNNFRVLKQFQQCRCNFTRNISKNFKSVGNTHNEFLGRNLDAK